MRRHFRLFSLFIVLVLCAAAGETSRRSPEFSMLRVGAQPISFSAYRGKILAIAFIDTQCPHCQELTKVLSRISHDYSARGVQILECAFNDQAKQTIPDFIEQFHPPFPVGYAYQPGVMSYLQYSILDPHPLYVPHMVFIDRRGIIRGDYAGEDNFFREPDARIRAQLNKLLKQPSAPTGASASRSRPSHNRTDPPPRP
jgi:peroxiredoxin